MKREPDWGLALLVVAVLAMVLLLSSVGTVAAAGPSAMLGLGR